MILRFVLILFIIVWYPYLKSAWAKNCCGYIERIKIYIGDGEGYAE